MFYAAKHKSIHLQWRNVGQTRRKQGCILRTTPITPWQEPPRDKVPVCRDESKTWPETRGGVRGGGKVLCHEQTELLPQPEQGTSLCGKHALPPASRAASSHAHTVPLTLSSPVYAGSANYNNSKTLCCTRISPWGAGGKTNNT